MDDYNSNSSGSESDQEDGVQSSFSSHKRGSTFVMNNDFDFDMGGSNDGKPLQSWSFQKLRQDIQSQRPAHTTSVNEKIDKLLNRKETRAKNLQAALKAREQNAKQNSDDDDDEDDEESENDDEEDDENDASDDEDVDEDDDEDDEDDAEDDEGDADEEEDEVIEEVAAPSKSSSSSSKPRLTDAGQSVPSGGIVRDLSKVPTRIAGRPARVEFGQLNLSKPLLRAVSDLGFSTATPVQAATIPIALTGSDVLANAVTGSGKTAAFMLPILERLLYRPRRVPTSRVVVLTPTRELAAQCHSMTENLGRYTDIRVCLIVGGLSTQVQEAALRQSPDIIVATPGRLIDHLRNSKSVHLEDVEILVLDEADRLLEMGFIDEVKEVVRACPKGRQTMLFSATLTDQVNDLAKLSLHNPQKIAVDPMYSLADHLIQEFIRIRPSRESDREAIVLALCARSFKSRVIVFFRNKIHCHRMAILFGLNGLNAAELHGNLTQTQRLEALDKFREGEVNFLLCTDLASRGLDIKGVETVINYHFPNQLASYIHRVGRTARAGQTGRSVTLVGEQQRKLLKEVVKRAPAGVKSRSLPDSVIAQFKNQIETQEQDVIEIIKQEKMEKELRVAEMQANKANNMMQHEREIMTRPKKTWFQTEKERQAAKLAGRDEDDVDSDEEGSADKKKSNKKKGGKDEDDDGSMSSKKKKDDPYAGMSRKQKRRKMLLDQETKEMARDLAEERVERAAAGSDEDDDEDGDKKKKSKKKTEAKPVKVKITKKDLEAAGKKLANLQNQQKALAKTLKKETIRQQLSLDEDLDRGFGSSDKKRRPSAGDEDDDDEEARRSSKKSKPTASPAASAHQYEAEMEALGRPASHKVKKMAKRAAVEAGDVKRFAGRQRDPDSFGARYKQSSSAASKGDDDGPKKPFRVKSNKSFKSKARHKRR